MATIRTLSYPLVCQLFDANRNTLTEDIRRLRDRLLDCDPQSLEHTRLEAELLNLEAGDAYLADEATLEALTEFKYQCQTVLMHSQESYITETIAAEKNPFPKSTPMSDLYETWQRLNIAANAVALRLWPELKLS